MERPSNSIKITDLISNSDKSWYSLEVSPGVDVDLVYSARPLFCSITWHAKNHKCTDLEIPSMKLAEELGKKYCAVLMHITCDNLRKSYLDEVLRKLNKINITNIFVVQGDKFDKTTSDFTYAKDLVSYIRRTTGSEFCIGVAGYPDSDDTALKHLKEKVNAGADFIITQAFFEIEKFDSFKIRCEEIKIEVPIIPGLFIFESAEQLKGFIKLCGCSISEKMNKYLEGNEPEDLMKNIVRELRRRHSPCHFFTINRIAFLTDYVKLISL